tara:strand:- start:2308 stop:3552 length:1245 start_codon:yes stop_codon:yes gene_type:complete
MVSIKVVDKKKKKKPTLRERAEFQQTPEGKAKRKARAERIRQERERKIGGAGGKDVIFTEMGHVLPAKENPELFAQQQAEREALTPEEQERKFIDIEKGKITAKKTAKKELADEKRALLEGGDIRETRLGAEKGLTEEQLALLEGGTINQDLRQLEGQPSITDQPKGVQALQTGLLDIASTGGAGSIVRGGLKMKSMTDYAKRKLAKEQAFDLANKEALKKAGITQAQHIKTLEKISQASGKSVRSLDKQLSNMIARGELQKLAGFGKQGVNWKKWGIGAGVASGATILQADAYLANWYVLDNIVGGTLFNSNDMVKDFKFNPDEDPSDAIAILQEELDTTIAIAKEKVVSSTHYNPFAMIHKAIFLAGLNKDIRLIERNIEKLELLREGKPITDVFTQEIQKREQPTEETTTL